MKIEITIGEETEEEWNHWYYCKTIDEALILIQKLKRQEINEQNGI